MCLWLIIYKLLPLPEEMEALFRSKFFIYKLLPLPEEMEALFSIKIFSMSNFHLIYMFCGLLGTKKWFLEIGLCMCMHLCMRMCDCKVNI